MNKNELIEAVAAKTGGTKADAARNVEATFDTITEVLADKEEVRIVGFGSFLTTERKATTGRNPRTGEEIKIAAATQAKFRPGKLLKETING